jgi:hypothetical protein
VKITTEWLTEEENKTSLKDGIRLGLEAAEKLTEPKTDALLLACGEMTRNELKTVRAVLTWIARDIKTLNPEEIAKDRMVAR